MTETGKKRKKFSQRAKGRKNPKKDDFVPKTNPDSGSCPGNDFNWYNKNPQLLTSAGSLIFSKRYGDIYSSLSYTGTGFTVQDYGNRSVAGVISAQFFEFVSALGTDADPINIAGKNLFTWLRHKNSGAKVFEASDLIQVLLSSGSIKVAIEYAKKLLRCVATYSAVNRFAMRYIIPFSDSEFNNMVANLANYTARLNMLIAKATSIIIPQDIPLFSRWKWLAANVFRDDELKKCSYYTFEPAMIWHYDWANHKCTVQALGTTTFTQLLTIIESEINNLLSYDDYGTISGDILKAYGETNLDVTTGMSLGEIQDPTFDLDAVRQFKNMTIAGKNLNYEIDQVSANTQLVQTVNTVSAEQTALPGKYIWDPTSFDVTLDKGIVYLPKLAVTSDQPSVEEVVEQTRLSGVIKSAYLNTVNPNRLYYEEVGSEVIVGCHAAFFDSSNFTVVQTTNELETIQFVDATNAFDTIGFIKSRSIDIGVKGDPQFCAILYDGSDMYAIQYFHGDNITVLDENFLSTVHKACVLSEWTMPMFSFLEVK